MFGTELLNESWCTKYIHTILISTGESALEELLPRFLLGQRQCFLIRGPGLNESIIVTQRFDHSYGRRTTSGYADPARMTGYPEVSFGR